MSNINLFELAARKKLRFESSRGLLSTEQLFDLSLQALDQIAIALDKKIRDTAPKSFISDKPAVDSDAQNSLEIVKHIIEYKQKQAAANSRRQELASQRKILQDAIAQKTLEGLVDGSLDDLQKRLAALDEQVE